LYLVGGGNSTTAGVSVSTAATTTATTVATTAATSTAAAGRKKRALEEAAAAPTAVDPAEYAPLEAAEAAKYPHTAEFISAEQIQRLVSRDSRVLRWAPESNSFVLHNPQEESNRWDYRHKQLMSPFPDECVFSVYRMDTKESVSIYIVPRGWDT
jgi:hypothetical protein